MKQVIEGSHAISEAARLARVKVIAGYPITPQTHIIEALSEYCEDGRMDAKFIPVESEHSAMASVVGAASTGVRTFTATSSHGLALMHELLHWAAASRLPIVMGEVNRAMGPGWNIWTDQTDSLAQRDTGWIQLYCEDAQEALDTTILAYRLAELVNLPVMVIIDAFFVSHTYEPVIVPEQSEVDRFLPAYKPKFEIDTNNPFALNQMAPPAIYMEMRRSVQLAMEKTLEIYNRIEDEFEDVFGRRYGGMETIRCDDADIIIVTSGSATSTCRLAVDELRKQGEKVGILKIKMFRPFPAADLAAALSDVQKVAVVDRNFSFGAGGIFTQEIKSALCNCAKRPDVFGYIAGLGGRDITTDTFKDIYFSTKNMTAPKIDSQWVGINEELL
ncbi:transketolase C-terminal domain-containing protein [Desulfobacterales bacterium HSG16]|nr:transketolase C-terminal domain-containing protein [Desulfobacterales bacterium HSG16]